LEFFIVSSVHELQQRLSDAIAPGVVSDQAPKPAAADALALALVDIARHYGHVVSLDVLTAGLPQRAGQLPFEYASQAAEHGRLQAETVVERLAAVSDISFPVIVADVDRKLQIVWQRRDGMAGQEILWSTPGEAERSWRPVNDAEAASELEIIKMRPMPRGSAYAGGLSKGKPENWFLAAFKSSWSVYYHAIAATFAINVLALAMPLFTMNVYDRVLPNAAIETLWALAIGVCIATVFDFIIKLLRGRFVDAGGKRADVLLANKIFGRLLGAKMSGQPPSIGVRANTLREFETLRDFFNSFTLTALGDLPFLFLFIGVIAMVGGALALVPLAAIPIVLGIGWLTQRSLGRLIEESFKETGQKSAVLVEMLTGMDTLKASNAESFAAAKWEVVVAENIRVTHKIRNVSMVGQLSIQTVQALTQVLIIVLGFFLLVDGKLTMGALIASTMLTGRALQPLGQMGGLLSRLNQARIAYQSLSEIVQAPQEAGDGNRLADNVVPRGVVEFENVSFAYDPESPASLNGVSFKAEPGERIAIIGGIGSGKSTALRLIHGHFEPTAGRVLLDGIPTQQIHPVSLRNRVGLALQQCDLFQGTIRANIALSNPGASDDAIFQAAKTSGALDWILKLPMGLDTPIGERGNGLSGGQRQSIALARALFSEPKVLLLDEPTSDMDPRTEALIVQRLARSYRDSTIIIVTHRPALLDLADRLIVLEGGRKLLDGPKASVMQSLRAMTEKAKNQTGNLRATA